VQPLPLPFPATSLLQLRVLQLPWLLRPLLLPKPPPPLPLSSAP
jgi:hypothetical protein